MRVAIVYDRLNKIGGAEHILQEFHSIYPQADWYASVWDPQHAPYSRDWQVTTSWFSKIPYFRIHHELFPFLMPFIFESFDFHSYDLVISISSAEAKGIITGPETLHLNYCLTPTRYLWSHREEYLDSVPGLIRNISDWIIHRMQAWDRVAAQRPDVMISISNLVKNRVNKYYHRSTDVIYPPVDVARFTDSNSDRMQLSVTNEPYYLIISRLVAYKNIRLAVDAFNRSGKRLVIVGTGSESKRLRKLAHANIIFTGFVTDDQVAEYYRNCQAYLQCNEEDFGISMVEALASGKPVVAYARGGACEIVTPETGVLYNELSAASLNAAIEALEKQTFHGNTCRKRAKIFDKTNWNKNIKQRIHTEWKNHKRIFGS